MTSCGFYCSNKIVYVILILFSIALTTFINSQLASKSQNLVLIDCDVGIDDAQALILAIKAHQMSKIKIIGVSCVNGNTKVENCVINVKRVFNVFNISENEIPIFKGAVSPLIYQFNFAKYPPFNGYDGLGDATWPLTFTNEINQNETAVYEIIRLAKLHPGQLTIVALGPLTNIALAIKLNSEFKSLLKELVMMGGNIHGVGNIKMGAEFNFYSDPEAAFIVLNNIQAPMKIIPLEICEDNYIPCERRINTLGNVNSIEANFINKIEKNSLEFIACKNGTGKWITFDQIAMAAFLYSNVEEESQDYYCTVELEGKYTRGMMMVDYGNHMGIKPNMKVVTKINKTNYENALFSIFGHVLKK